MIEINNDNKLTIPSTTKVSCVDKIVIIFPGGEEELIVNIEADFGKLKPEHHELFLQSFNDKYNHDTNIWNTHTNYDGSKVPIKKGKLVEKKSFWKKLLNIK